MAVAPLPWPGPRPYTDQLSPVFRGRDKDLMRVLEQLQGQKLSLMTASSGAGKTSLLQAGVIPRIREFRIKERGGALARPPVAPFPMLVNQWLERAGKGETIDFSHLLTLEMHRFLRRSLEWYDMRRHDSTADASFRLGVDAEVAAIHAAMDSLAEIAEAEGFAKRSGSLPASPLTWQPREGQTATRSMVDRLLKVIDGVSEHLGEILLILDQFEEILLDWRLGQQAQDAVESVFRLRRSTVRQLISMRNDGVHLIDDLEKKGLLENKRKFEIEPLAQSAIEGIIREVSADAGHEWEESPIGGGASLLSRLVDSFTYTRTGGGTRVGEVNLVGLQVVLNGMFRDLAAGEAVTPGALELYCGSLALDENLTFSLDEWLDVNNPSGLTHRAPLSWIARCLLQDENEDHKADIVANVFELQIQPLAARLSWLLVTPAGNKRTMTAGELHAYAYLDDADDLNMDDLSGKAAEDAWTTDDYLSVMQATCDEALARLTRGNVLKMRGSESGEDVAYELVHDQFGRPFQAWSDDFQATPEFDLNSLRALKSIEFKWKGALSPHDDDGIIPHAKWLDCSLNEVDLSDLTFVHCDFGESIFSGCTFNDVAFEDCDLTNVTFKASSFDNVTFVRSELTSSQWRDGTSLRSVKVIEGGAAVGMSFARLSDTMLTDCRFCVAAEESDSPVSERHLPMQYVQFIDCGFAGEVEFDRCSLGTVVVKGLSGPCRVDGTIRFVDCLMPGSELSNLDVRGSTLSMIDCDCRAAAFITINAGPDENGAPSVVDFSNVVLIGAAMVDCTLDGVAFTGPPDTQDGSQRGLASAFTIRSRPGGEVSPIAPCRLANISFRGLQADNLSIAGCEIDGDLTFEDCILTGAEFVGDDGSGVASEARAIGGSITFKCGCDTSAAKFVGLRFTAAHALEMSDCVARGMLFRDVEFAGESLEHPAAVFQHSDLGGASFIGSELRGVRFNGGVDEAGLPQTPMPSLVIFPSQGSTDLRAALSHVAFENMFMPGFVFRDVVVDDDITFTNCNLGSGSITQTEDGQSTRLSIRGDLLFTDCAMDAIEFSRLEFLDESLRIIGGHCKGALFNEVAFLLESEQESGLLIEHSDLSGALFLDCQISRSRLTADSSKHLSKALSVSFKETPGRAAFLCDSVIENYVFDGGTLEGLAVTGSLAFRGCSLLRTKFSDLDIGADAVLDLTQSDLLYAEVDPELIEDRAHFRITDHQRGAILDQRKHKEILRLRSSSTSAE